MHEFVWWWISVTSSQWWKGQQATSIWTSRKEEMLIYYRCMCIDGWYMYMQIFHNHVWTGSMAISGIGFVFAVVVLGIIIQSQRSGTPMTACSKSYQECTLCVNALHRTWPTTSFYRTHSWPSTNSYRRTCLYSSLFTQSQNTRYTLKLAMSLDRFVVNLWYPWPQVNVPSWGMWI